MPEKLNCFYSLSSIEPLILCHMCRDDGGIEEFIYFTVVLPFDAARKADGEIIERSWQRHISEQMTPPMSAENLPYVENDGAFCGWED